MAREKFNGIDAIQVIQSNWTHGLSSKLFPRFDAIVVKNSLHLITSPQQHLRALRQQLADRAVIVVCETIMPDDYCMSFVQSLFDIVDAVGTSQKNILTRAAIKQMTANADYEVLRQEDHKQYIEVEKWTSARAAGQGCADRVRHFITEQFLLSKHLAQWYEATFDKEGHATSMLRLQHISSMRSRDG
jgi:hypothetical protein